MKIEFQLNERLNQQYAIRYATMEIRLRFLFGRHFGFIEEQSRGSFWFIERRTMDYKSRATILSNNH